jgi:hypothetical protein
MDIIFGFIVSLLYTSFFCAHFYFSWLSEKQLEKTASNLPESVDELVSLRQEELKTLRKVNVKNSYRLGAINLKLGDQLLEESEDLYDQLSPSRFVQLKTIFKIYQSEVLGIFHSGRISIMVNAALILLMLPMIWILGVFAILFFLGTQYETNLAKILAARKMEHLATKDSGKAI